MSPKHASETVARRRHHALVFAALGDELRLGLIGKLAEGEAKSIAQLTEGSKVTRQAVTKHLRVLEEVGVVRSTRRGRESLFELDLSPFRDAREYLQWVSEQWDDALSRLKSFVEQPER